MAEVVRDGAFPNVLCVVGSDVYGADGAVRERLAAALDAAPSGLLGRGSHDIWFVHWQAHADDAWAPNHFFGDLGNQPRPGRGRVAMPIPNDTADATMSNQVDTLVHEAAHSWLVPSDLRFRTSLGEVGVLSQRDQVDRVNRGLDWQLPALIGRDDAHWSAYVDGRSTMDGTAWHDRGADHGLTRWDERPSAPVSAALPAIGNTVDLPQLNDMDLVALGALHVSDALSATAGELRWLEAQLVSNMNFQIGLTVMLTPTDQVRFGFDRDHRVLAVRRNGAAPVAVGALGDTYDPRIPVLLRVVRRGRTLRFEAARSGTADPLALPTGSAASSDGALHLNDHEFTTLASLDVASVPVAIGPTVRTWSALFVEAEFAAMFLEDAGGRRALRSDVDPPDLDLQRDLASALVADELRRLEVDGPPGTEPAATVRAADRRLIITARWGVVGPEGPAVPVPVADDDREGQRSPKALVRLEPGDFAFAATARVRRTLFSPATGGATAGSSMWGHRRGVRATDTIFNEVHRLRWSGDPDLNVAFVVVADRRADLDAGRIAAVDRSRQLFDEVFERVTRGRWRSDSRMTTWRRLHGVRFSSPPSLTAAGRAVHAFALDQGRQPWHTSRTDGAWSPWHGLGGTFTSPITATSWGPDRLDIVARGDDRRIYHSFRQDGSWGDWAPVGVGVFSSAPSIVSWGRNRLDIFALGDDRRVYHLFFGLEAWGAWEPLGHGTFQSIPAVTTWGPGRLDLFALGDDRRVYHLFHDDPIWGDWQPLGFGTFTSPPAAVSWGSGRLDVFARGDDRRVYHTWFDSEQWGDWEPLGAGTFTSAPRVVSWERGRLAVVALGDDQLAYHTWFDDERWGHWEPLGSPDLDAPPAICSRGPGALDLLGQAGDRLYGVRFDGEWFP